MFARFTRLFGRTFAPPSERRTRSNLRVESLEDRTVPAALTWCPPGEDWTFDQADNWLIGNSPAGRIPAAGDSIVFDGAVTQLPCYGMHGASGGAYVAVSMSVDFPMATVSGDFTTDDLTLAGGAFSNTTTGIDLTVTDELTWTGGSLNSSSYAGTIHLAGTTAAIDPSSGVSTGSNLSFENGITATVEPGTITFNNSTSFSVSATSSLLFNATDDVTFAQAAPPTDPNAINGTMTVDHGGTVTFGGVTQNSGTVLIKNGSTLSCQDTSAYSYTQGVSTAVTKIENGSTLVAAGNGVMLLTGELSTLYKTGSGTQTATIQGKLTVMSGDMYITKGGTGNHPTGTLYVTGNMTWRSGVLHVKVDNVGCFADLLSVGGSLSVDTTNTFLGTPGASLAVTTVASGVGPPYPPGTTYLFLEAFGGISLTGNLPPAGNDYTVVAQNSNPVTYWNLKSN